MGRKRQSVNPKSVVQRGTSAVLKMGEATIHQVMGVVGKHITSAQAEARAKERLKVEAKRKVYRRNPGNSVYSDNEYMAKWGRYLIVTLSLRDATNRGLIRRVKPGVYAAPIAKIYQPPQVG